MGRIVVTEFVSIDGVVEDPGGVEGFKHGGWVFDFDRGEDGERFKLEETLDTEALLLGRVTYEEFVKAWPSRTGEFADKFNSLPKYVVSSTLLDPIWNSTLLDGELVEEVSKLKQELGGNIVVHGSIQLVRTLVEHDLVDELRLMLFPIVLGSGERLFEELSDAWPLQLASATTVGEGVTILVYEPVREHEDRPHASDRPGIRERIRH